MSARVRRTRSTFATVLAGAVVLSAFGTSTAVAGSLITSARIKNNTIKSIDIRDNTVRGTDVLDGSITRADVADGSLTGADVQDATLTNADVGAYFAQVWENGELLRSSGGVTVTKPGNAGKYEVDFGRDVTACAYAATVGGADAASWVGSVGAATGKVDDPDVVVVATHNWSGTPVNLPFQLIVVC